MSNEEAEAEIKRIDDQWDSWPRSFIPAPLDTLGKYISGDYFKSKITGVINDAIGWVDNYILEKVSSITGVIGSVVSKLSVEKPTAVSTIDFFIWEARAYNLQYL